MSYTIQQRTTDDRRENIFVVSVGPVANRRATLYRRNIIEAEASGRRFAAMFDRLDSATLSTRTNDSETLSQKEGF